MRGGFFYVQKTGDHMTVDQTTAIDQATDAALNDATPQEILAWAAERYGKDITMACSFGGPTGMVLVDMVSKLGLDEPIAYRARWSIEAQAAEFGPRLWETNPDLCCALRKVEPNGRALEGKQAWITGLRRDQSSTRTETNAVEWDAKFGLVKVNPLVNWSEAQVWDYIRENDVPYNDLHDGGFPSIGCTNCTRAILAGEDSRAGRWSGSDKIECGIHVADDDAIEAATR
jgi:phosphoadenosine phosphosulfate reductase